MRGGPPAAVLVILTHLVEGRSLSKGSAPLRGQGNTQDRGAKWGLFCFPTCYDADIPRTYVSTMSNNLLTKKIRLKNGTNTGE